MISQAEQMNGRVIALASTAPVQGFGAASSEPQITLTPRTSCGLRTHAIMFCQVNDIAGRPAALGVTIWKRHAATGRWAILAVVTGWGGEWVTICELNASQLWFQLVGNVDGQAVQIAIEEIGVSP